MHYRRNRTIVATIQTVSYYFCLCASCAVCAAAEPAIAIVTTATSDYDFRGETQTMGQPAIQVTLDAVAAESWHLGVFASNVNFGRQAVGGNPQLEISPVAELLREVGHETTITLGALYYLYGVNGGTPYDFGELEMGIAHGWFSTTLFFTPAWDGRVNGRRHSAQYWSTDLAVPPWRGLTLAAHLGYSWGPYWRELGGATAVDCSVGVGYSFHKFDLKLQQIVRTSILQSPGTSLVATSRTIFSVSRSFSVQ
ncbi:MAG TPA: TorF family putative porin [Steroidobacteraceae bacterium]|jgi:uncharacterized protein (TIGR02001 family)